MASSPTTKSWYQSKTIWFNILTIGGAVMDGVLGLLPTVQPLIAPEVYPLVLFTLGVVNVILRAITTSGIGWQDVNED